MRGFDTDKGPCLRFTGIELLNCVNFSCARTNFAEVDGVYKFRALCVRVKGVREWHILPELHPIFAFAPPRLSHSKGGTEWDIYSRKQNLYSIVPFGEGVMKWELFRGIKWNRKLFWTVLWGGVNQMGHFQRHRIE